MNSDRNVLAGEDVEFVDVHDRSPRAHQVLFASQSSAGPPSRRRRTSPPEMLPEDSSQGAARPGGAAFVAGARRQAPIAQFGSMGEPWRVIEIFSPEPLLRRDQPLGPGLVSRLVRGLVLGRRKGCHAHAPILRNVAMPIPRAADNGAILHS
jgi:hypothetical protein